MSVVRVEKNNYTAEPLYQWDLNQVLEIRGLSLASIPEIHYTNAAMEKALVRQATMDTAGVIRAEIPNSMLQRPYRVTVYVCVYEGTTFHTAYKLEIPVKERPQPADYVLVDDPEVYSFNALEAEVHNVIRDYSEIERKYKEAVELLEVTNEELQDAKDAYIEATRQVADVAASAAETAARDAVGNLSAGDLNAYEKNEVYAKNETYAKEEALAAGTKELYGLDEADTPDDAFQAIHGLLGSKDLVELVRFTTDGTFNPASYPTTDGLYTVVLQGAGGSGANHLPGYGGGAGAVAVIANLPLLSGIVPVTVGKGGVGVRYTGDAYYDGNDGGGTSFGGFFVPGGKGGPYSDAPTPVTAGIFTANVGTKSAGGDSFLGKGGLNSTSSNGGTGGIGAGGGAATAYGSVSGAGGDGVVIVYGRRP